MSALEQAKLGASLKACEPPMEESAYLLLRNGMVGEWRKDVSRFLTFRSVRLVRACRGVNNNQEKLSNAFLFSDLCRFAITFAQRLWG